MHINTLKAIDLWLKMYSEEELKGLSLVCGQTTVTFEEALLARYEDSLVRGSVFTFKSKCAQIVVANRLWVLKIIKTNSEAYQKWIETFTPQHFKKRTHTIFGYDKDQQTLKHSTDSYDKLSRDFSKTRTGDSEMAEEVNLDKEWTKESLDFLKSASIEKLPKLRRIPEPPAPPALAPGEHEIFEDTFLETGKKKNRLNAEFHRETTSDDQSLSKPEFFTAPDVKSVSSTEGGNENEELVFKSASTSMTVKGFRTGHASEKQTYAETVSDTEGSRTVDQFSTQEIVHEYQKFDPIDVMERYLQKFDCLFTKSCQ